MAESRYNIEGYAVEVDSVEKAQWADILDGFSDASLYSTWSYGAIRWSEKNLSHLILKKDDDIVAAAQVRIVKFPVFGDYMAYITHGPIWKRRGCENDIEVFGVMLKALKQEYVIKRSLLLRVVPNEIVGENEDVVTLLGQEGFDRQSGICPYKTSVIDLSASVDELMSGFHKRWREKLRRSQRNDLEIVEGTDEKLYDEFAALYSQMHDRKKFVQFMDLEQFRALQKDLPDRFKMKIMICKSHSEPASALIFSMTGESGFPVFSATGNNGLKVHASYLLRWTMLEELKERGCRYLDQGGIDIEKNPGGYKFKMGMGGREVSYIGHFDLCQSRVRSVLVKAGFRSRDGLRFFLRYLNRIKNTIYTLKGSKFLRVKP